MVQVWIIFVIAATSVCLASIVCQAESIDEQWTQYKRAFNKTYLVEQEHSMRFEMFQNSLAKINKHNDDHANGLASFSMGLNHMSDWTPNEVQKLMGLRMDLHKNVGVSVKLAKLLRKWRKLPLPESIDWSQDKTRVGPVRDQGQCGSCWAFATVGLLEGQDFVNSTGGIRQLSPQNLVDCNKQDAGCEGGLVSNAIAYVKKSGGMEDDKDYPYFSGKTQEAGKCKFDRKLVDKATSNIIDYSDLPSRDEKTLKLVVANYGPVAVGVGVIDSLVHYKSGVYDDPACNLSINHAVLVVGYGKSDDGKDFWKIKNSWADFWGQDGFFYLARGKQMCRIGNMGTVALMNGNGYL